MAGLVGNLAWLGGAKQTARGAAAAGAQFKWPLTSGTIQPTRTTDHLSETDASRDQGVTFVQQTGIEGSPAVYARDASLPWWLKAVQGANVTSGSTPNFTHTVTMAAALQYNTFWRNIGNTLYEQFVDVLVSELTISADAGNPLTVAASVMGRTPTRLATDPSLLPWTTPADALDSGPVYNYNDATVTLGGVATALVGSFELGINNNVTTQQTDDSVPYDLVPGLREVTLGFDLIFENLTEYNKFHYGGAAGTAVSPNVFTTSADFVFSKGANNSIEFSLPTIAYEEFPVEPDAGGAPVTVAVRATGQRPTSGSILTSIVKNQLANAAGANY